MIDLVIPLLKLYKVALATTLPKSHKIALVTPLSKPQETALATTSLKPHKIVLAAPSPKQKTSSAFDFIGSTSSFNQTYSKASFNLAIPSHDDEVWASFHRVRNKAPSASSSKVQWVQNLLFEEDEAPTFSIGFNPLFEEEQSP